MSADRCEQACGEGDRWVGLWAEGRAGVRMWSGRGCEEGVGGKRGLEVGVGEGGKGGGGYLSTQKGVARAVDTRDEKRRLKK